MKYTKEDILEKIKSLSHQEDFLVAEKFLLSSDLNRINMFINGKNSHERSVKSSDTIKTWSKRLKNPHNRKKLYGCKDFIEKLHNSLPETTLINVCFKSKNMTGIFWFSEKTEDIFGFVITADE